VTTTAPNAEVRGRIRPWIRNIGGGSPVYPLAVLFGLSAVDQLDKTAFAVLLPDIRDHFHLDTQGILTLVFFASVAAILLSVPIGFIADRRRRVPIAIVGAIAWGCFSLLTGLATSIWLLVIARAGSGLGEGVNVPTHNSLLADYYPIAARPRVYSIHRSAIAVGAFTGPLVAGVLADSYGWRLPFIVYTIPTVIVVLFALRLREPIRGHFEREAMGAAADAIATEDIAPSFAESWRIVWNVGTLRRIFYALPFLAVAFVGLGFLSSLFYSRVFHLGVADRGYIAAGVEPAQLLGLIIGTPIATRLLMRSAALIPKFIAAVSVVVAIAWAGFALSPSLPVAVVLNAIVSGGIVLILPTTFAALSLTIPPKVRSFGFSAALLWILPGLVVLLVIGALADSFGIRVGILVMVPVFLIGSALIASAGLEIDRDIRRVWGQAAAQSEVLYERRQGRVKMLLCRGIDVKYDNVQVLFKVDFDIDEGEIVALLGTNGAGKSTLLKAIAGLVEPSDGSIIFDGRDMTYTPPNETAERGVTMVPGGQGVFPGLTVRENLSLAGWLHRKDKEHIRTSTDHVLGLFPVLRERLDQTAGNLSGGQQQMLTLGMAFIERPRLLMIDELSLGLAPAVVGQLLGIVRELRDAGTTIILVEQSVNVALTVAETAYFMEKGEIRFHGPTAELLERPDVLRSVFLEGAASKDNTSPSKRMTTPATATPRPATNGDAPVPERGDDILDRSGHAERGPSGPARRAESGSDDRLEVRGLRKRYGGVVALDDVSLTVKAGEIVGFIGPNGAGKTSLFDAISGFLPIDGGRVLMAANDGETYDLTDRPAQIRSRLGLGRSFQDGRLFPALTVRETIAVALECSVGVKDPIAAALHLPAVIDSEAAVYERVEQLIEFMGLEAFRDKFTHELSTGSRRIVDLACVLAHQPTVLLLDEPSSGIAQRESEALGPLMIKIRDQLGASLLVIEHDLPLLSSVSDRMVAMDLGRVIAEGTPEDVVHDPQVVASYLGDNEAAIARSGDRT
jgi:ABC-type branched-chain amino acid transport systems, ATPase component